MPIVTTRKIAKVDGRIVGIWREGNGKVVVEIMPGQTSGVASGWLAQLYLPMPGATPQPLGNPHVIFRSDRRTSWFKSALPIDDIARCDVQLSEP